MRSPEGQICGINEKSTYSFGISGFFFRLLYVIVDVCERLVIYVLTGLSRKSMVRLLHKTFGF